MRISLARGPNRTPFRMRSDLRPSGVFCAGEPHRAAHSWHSVFKRSLLQVLRSVMGLSAGLLSHCSFTPPGTSPCTPSLPFTVCIACTCCWSTCFGAKKHSLDRGVEDLPLRLPTGQLGEHRQCPLLTRLQLSSWGSGRLPLPLHRASLPSAAALVAEARTGSAGQSSGDRRGGLEAAAAPEAAASAGAKLSSGRRRAAPAEATTPVAADKAGGAARSAGSPVTEAGGSAQQAEAAATEQFWPALALSLSTDNGTVATKRAAKRPPRDKASGADVLPRRDSLLLTADLHID